MSAKASGLGASTDVIINYDKKSPADDKRKNLLHSETGEGQEDQEDGIDGTFRRYSLFSATFWRAMLM